jgi:hypothetical protein
MFYSYNNSFLQVLLIELAFFLVQTIYYLGMLSPLHSKHSICGVLYQPLNRKSTRIRRRKVISVVLKLALLFSSSEL